MEQHRFSLKTGLEPKIAQNVRVTRDWARELASALTFSPTQGPSLAVCPWLSPTSLSNQPWLRFTSWLLYLISCFAWDKLLIEFPEWHMTFNIALCAITTWSVIRTHSEDVPGYQTWGQYFIILRLGANRFDILKQQSWTWSVHHSAKHSCY